MPRSLSVFMSYAHEDDEQDDYYLSEFRQALSREVSAQWGREFSIFQDRAHISLGQKWKTQIKEALSSISFFMPIITPAFFESRECRAELEVFLEREKELDRDDLIWPIYYIESPLIENEEAAARNRHAQRILEHQYADWRKLRKAPLNSPPVQQRIQEIAGQICLILKRKVWGKVIAPDFLDRFNILDSFLAHDEGGINDLAVSPDNEILATASSDLTVRLWDLPHCYLLSTLAGHSDLVASVAFSPDGQTLVSASHDGTVRLWNTATGEQIHVFKYSRPREGEGLAKFATGAVFHPFESQIAACYFDNYIRIWSIDQRKLVRKWKGLSAMSSIACSSNGDYLAASSMSEGAKIWYYYTGEQALEVTNKDKREQSRMNRPLDVRSIAIDPYVDLVATAANTDTGDQTGAKIKPIHSVRVWDLPDGQLVNELTEQSESITRVFFSPDGTMLASVSDDTTLHLWNLPDFEPLASIQVGEVGGAAFSPNGSLLLCGSADGTVTVYGIK